MKLAPGGRAHGGLEELLVNAGLCILDGAGVEMDVCLMDAVGETARTHKVLMACMYTTTVFPAPGSAA